MAKIRISRRHAASPPRALPAGPKASPEAPSKASPTPPGADLLQRARQLGHHIGQVNVVAPGSSGPDRLQRVFTYSHAVIDEPFFVLRYLLDRGWIRADDQKTIDDFKAKASKEEVGKKRKRGVEKHALPQWLKDHGIRGSASQILADAKEWAGQRSGWPEGGRDEGGGPDTILGLELGEDDSDSDFQPDRKRARTATEESADDSSDDGEKVREGPSTEHPILVVTWNLEKYGLRSDQEKKRLKREAILKIVDLYHPSVFVLQEVTDAGLLFEGRAVQRGEGIPLGGGIATANLFQLVNGGRGEIGPAHQPKAPFPLDPEESGLIAHYPLQEEYGLLEGPRYKAGEAYREYYPLLYDRARIQGAPEPFFIRAGKSGYRLESVPEGHEESFSSKKAITRELLVWKVPIQVGGYLFRPSTLEETGREAERQDVYVCVVHTSPSNQVGIREETEEILRKATWLRQQLQAPVILAGDWYMEKENPKLFSALAEGEKDGWSLAASELGLGDVPLPERVEKKGAKGKGKGKKKAEPKPPRYHQTNFPHKGRGQTADHFVISEGLRTSLTQVIPVGEKQERWLGIRGRTTTIDEEPDLHGWTETGADHVPVLTVVSVVVSDVPDPVPAPSPRSARPGAGRKDRGEAPEPKTSKRKKEERLRPLREGGGPGQGQEPQSRKKRRTGLETESVTFRPKGSATAYVRALTGGAGELVPINGNGLSCYLRSILTGLELQGLEPRGEHDVESLITLIRAKLKLPSGALNAGGSEARRIRDYIAAHSLAWFGVANVQVQANIVQAGQGDWEVQHWESTGAGSHVVWLRYQPGGVGHFDLIDV